MDNALERMHIIFNRVRVNGSIHHNITQGEWRYDQEDDAPVATMVYHLRNLIIQDQRYYKLIMEGRWT